jgi:hypothetical protein
MNNPMPCPLSRMNRLHRYAADPSGRCIYCGNLKIASELFEEHIIPRSLGGRLILPHGSCADCQDETHAFEGRCAGQLFLPIRRQQRFPQRHTGRKERTKTEWFTATIDGVERQFSAEDFPALLVSFNFRELPGILTGAAPTEQFLGEIAMGRLPGFGDRLARIGRRYGANEIKLPNARHIKDFGRMLAKIAHAFAVAELGYGSFSPLLIDIILNKPPLYYSHYIGGLGEMPDGDDLHIISIDNTGFFGDQRIVVNIQLFANYAGMPMYYVVAGDRL